MIIFLTIFFFSIVLHELGHLLTALLFKVRVNAFSIGFGPILLHKKWKGIDWRLSLLPLGGYCDIEEGLKASNSLANISYWKQVIILLAGVTLNLLVALIAYLIHYSSISKGIMIDWLFLKSMISKDYYTIAYLLQFINLPLFYLSFINSTSFLFNILPLPCLDGGYLYLLPLKRKMSDKFYKYLIGVSFALLMILQFAIIIYWWFN